MALRELVLAVGFQIDSHPLVAADQATDAFKAKVLGAEADTLQLGASIEAAGATATASMGAAALSTSQLGAAAVQAGADASAGLAAAATESRQLGAAVDAAQGPYARLREVGVQAAEALKQRYAEHKAQIEEIGQTLEKNRVLIAGVFGATAGTIGFSVKRAADFEAAMSRVGALARANDEELDLLSRTARELGASTVFSASQAAEGMSYLAMAGFQVQDIVAAMPGLLDTAAAAQSGLGVTADIVSNILSGFQLEARETGRVADVLTATFTSSNTTLESLGDTMSYVAPVASSLGISLEEVAAMTGRLGDVGIQGQRAGTALRAIFSRLAAPTGEAARILRDLGVSTTDASGNLLPMIDIMRQIEARTQTMGSAQRSAILTTLVGVEAVSAFTALLDAGTDNIETYADTLRNSAGVAQLVAAKQMDNLRGALEELGSAVEETQISIGTAFIPVIRLGARALTHVVNVFNALPGPVKTTVAVGLGLVAMLSGVALAASFIIPQIPHMIKGFALLRTGMGAVTAYGAKMGVVLQASFWPITLGIGAVVIGVLLLQDVIMALRGEGDTLTGRAIAWGREIGGRVVGYIGQFSGALKVAGVVLGVIFGPQLVYTGAVAAVQFGGSMLQAGRSLIGLAAHGAGATAGMARLGAQLLVTGGRQAAVFVAGIAKAGVTLGAQMVMGLLAATKAAIGFNLALLANPITWVVAGIALLGVGLYGLVKNWDRAKEWAGGVWSSIAGGVGTAVASIGDRLKAGWTATSEWYSATAERVRGAGAAIGTGVQVARGWLRTAVESFRENPIGFVIDWSPFGLLRRGTESLLGWTRDWLAEQGIQLPEFQMPSWPALTAWAGERIDGFRAWLADQGIQLPSLRLPTWPALTAWASERLESFGDWLAERGISLPEISLPSFPDLIAWALGPVETFREWLSTVDFGSVLGDAISSAWGFITSPLESITQGIRDFLPFSPAKEGPLADLDRVGRGLIDTIAGSIRDAGADPMREALAGVLGHALPPEVPDPVAGESAAAAAGGAGLAMRGSPTFYFQLEVNVDAAGATDEDAERIGATTAASLREALEEWVAENFYSVALEEV